MPEGLETLPPEVFLRVLQELNNADLNALTLVSKSWKWHLIVAEELWKSVTIDPAPRSRSDPIATGILPRQRLRLARQLHFRSRFHDPVDQRCFHRGVVRYPWDAEDVSNSRNEENGEALVERPSHFDYLAGNVKSVLENLEDGQLDGFSWDLGTCVPPEALGHQSIISRHHASLRSLSLTTRQSCDGDHEEVCLADLSSFGQLQSLRWRAPRYRDLRSLSLAIERNSDHLRELELDLVRWGKVIKEIPDYWDIEFDQAAQRQCTETIFGLARQVPGRGPIFAAIRELCLTAVTIVPDLASAINFGTLRCLTLRRCANWDTLFTQALELGLSIRLTKLEICVVDDGYLRSDLDFQGAGRVVLDGVDGLEELFIAHDGPEYSLDIWARFVRHQATLKRFVHHQRNFVLPDDILDHGELWDLADGGVSDEELREIEEDPSRNPLSALELDFIGLCCVPARLKPILLPFTSKTSLKVLHIRQSESDAKRNCASWAVYSRYHRPEEEEEEEVEAHPTLRPGFRQFAEWAFGPQGIGSLCLVVYGDFAHRRSRDPGRNLELGKVLILCRNTSDGAKRNFRVVREDSPQARILDEYRDALGVCPIELDPVF